MKSVFCLFVCLMSLGALSETATIGVPHQPTLQVWDGRPQADFNAQVLPVLQGELFRCKACTVHNLTTYDDKGASVALTVGPVWSSWGTPEVFASQTAVLLLNSNLRMTPELKPLVDFINRVAELGTLVVLAAGQPAAGQNSAPLSITLAGKINHAIIIGELGERDRLWGASFFGPEMYTALRPSKDRIGLGTSPAQFAGRLLAVYPKQSDWLATLQAKKISNRKIWLDLSDCLGH